MIIHSTVLSTRLIKVSHIFHHNSWSTSKGISLKLLTEKSKSPEGVSIARSSLGSKMLREKVQIGFIQIMTSFAEAELLPVRCRATRGYRMVSTGELS